METENCIMLRKTESENVDWTETESLLLDAAFNGRLEEVIQLSSVFSNDVKLLSVTLINSCMKGHLNVVKWLVEHTAVDINYRYNRIKWYSPLIIAYECKQIDVVKYLLNEPRIDVNIEVTHNEGYRSLLLWACYDADFIMVKCLCEFSDGLNVNIANNRGNTALHYAVWHERDLGMTQLHEACRKKDVTEVRRLLSDCSYMLNKQNNFGYTPLHVACLNIHPYILEILMLEGADETIANDDGQTPAQLAASPRLEKWGMTKLLDRKSLWEIIQQKSKIQQLLKPLSCSFFVMLSILAMTHKLLRRRLDTTIVGLRGNRLRTYPEYIIFIRGVFFSLMFDFINN